MNLVVQTGRLARDIDLRYTPSNKAVAQFSIAVRKSFIKEGETDTAYFFPVVIWGVQAVFPDRPREGRAETGALPGVGHTEKERQDFGKHSR